MLNCLLMTILKLKMATSPTTQLRITRLIVILNKSPGWAVPTRLSLMRHLKCGSVNILLMKKMTMTTF